VIGSALWTIGGFKPAGWLGVAGLSPRSGSSKRFAKAAISGVEGVGRLVEFCNSRCAAWGLSGFTL
jgi:hypothetical protein